MQCQCRVVHRIKKSVCKRLQLNRHEDCIAAAQNKTIKVCLIIHTQRWKLFSVDHILVEMTLAENATQYK